MHVLTAGETEPIFKGHEYSSNAKIILVYRLAVQKPNNREGHDEGKFFTGVRQQTRPEKVDPLRTTLDSVQFFWKQEIATISLTTAR